MTLAECLIKHNLTQERHPLGGLIILDGQGIPDLWQLTNYRVSTVSCGNIWLVPTTNMGVPRS